jgi:hypothetical protein
VRSTHLLATFALALGLALPAVATTETASAQQVAKQERVITASIANVTRSKLQMRAKVAKYPRGATFLQRKTCKSCNWRNLTKKRTNAHGRVAYPVGAPATGRWYFRIGTPKNAHFARSYSQTFYTYQF